MRPPTAPELTLLVEAMTPWHAPATDFRDWDATRWERVLAAADWHRLAPVLFDRLRDNHAVPPGVRTQLEERYLANVARNMYMRRTLDNVLQALDAAGVPALPLKGAALIEMVYSDAGLREMFDLDLLVPRPQLAVAEAAVATLGFRDDPVAYGSEHLPRSLRAPDHHEPGLVSADGFTAVELHHHIAISGEGNGLAIGDVWRRARAAGTFELSPAPDDLLLHVALHYTRSRLAGRTAGALAQVCDMAMLAQRGQVDWERLVASACAYSLETRLFLALGSAAELGAPVPAEVVAALRPDGADASILDRFLALRVLRTSEHEVLRPLRRMVVPRRSRLGLLRRASSDAWLALPGAYVRRTRDQTPRVLGLFRRPLAETISDYRLSGELSTLEHRN